MIHWRYAQAWFAACALSACASRAQPHASTAAATPPASTDAARTPAADAGTASGEHRDLYLYQTLPPGMCDPVEGRADVEPLLEKGCAGGDPEGCGRLSLFYACGVGVDRDLRRAFTLAVEACDGGGIPACAMAGVFSWHLDHPTPAELSVGERALRKGCAGQDADACDDVAVEALQGHATADEARMALGVLEKRCAAGEASDCGRAASLYLLGVQGVRVDVDRAARLALPACANGDANGCNIAGAAYQGGYGGPNGPALSARYFERACTLHDPSGCDNLGVLYASGKGVAADPARAIQLFRQACDAGHARACTHLAEALASDSSPAQPIPAASMTAPRSP